MAGILPLFNSAPRMKIYINETTLAYAIGLNINISIDVQPINIVGEFGPVALEPTMYNIVTGTMQIIRLISKETRESLKTQTITNNTQITQTQELFQTNSSLDGNGNPVITENSNSPLARQNLYAHLDPSKVLLSQTFDIDIYIKLINGTVDTNTNTQELSANETQIRWMTIKDCRVTSRNTNISMGTLTNEPITFQGIYVTTTNIGATDNLMKPDDIIKNQS